MHYEESDTVELKQSLIDDVKKEMIAFLNTNGGTIYIGVTDNGLINPLTDRKLRDDLDTKISNWINDDIYPYSANYIKHYYNEDNVLVIKILEGNDKPYYLVEKGPKPSGVFKRVGRSKQQVSREEILNMIIESKKFIYEKEESDEQELTFEYFNSICDKNKIKHEKSNLKSLEMINNHDKYTNLALLLSDQSPIVVKFAKYNEKLDFLVKKQFTGSLLKTLDMVVEYTNTYNDVSAVINGDTFKRIENESYPSIALREAVLNAFAHANYFIRSNIKIEFFKDKVKITNPGGIYNATLEDVFSGIQTFRNPGLVRILDKLKYIENFGTGLLRIKEAYEKNINQPKFYVSENFFIIELPKTIYLHDGITESLNDSIIDPIIDPITDFDLELYQLIKNNPGLNVPKIQDILSKNIKGVTIDKIKNSLKRNLKNLVEFKGANKTGGYYLKK